MSPRPATSSSIACATKMGATAGFSCTLDRPVGSACNPELLTQLSLDPALTLTLGRIVWEYQPYLTNDVPNDPYLGMTGWIGHERITAFAGYPLLVDERVIGAMVLFS